MQDCLNCEYDEKKCYECLILEMTDEEYEEFINDK